ncbi:ABC transporter permease [Haloferax mediterranei ATCC 33500]|uniref:ABC transporter permease n=1 Tax=Haloferax mediterranei (strain ATCC 33500 / DSM 1411 / JCM 8866 / NBRC 14739 / NCIMB 2177 / R-4) TaxID=523841 RepID=I3R7C2_HALMT|nr:ABC transporter permease [Haloferax mediterranei]AFK20132.1 ABC-type dipeptide/oligopeptide/nickel transport system, permease protein I [Haloferax mediterranei ATCC 33500]AHZ23505.1 peptide ABC transporter permease [Haloferax mediterranei ATCC 33500]ELZ99679.1 ABC-type dipeptide/oligopeptide/nickel transport system, permease protein I [Haloferax mediterranei ATCC 33500]MDX5987117.1 ABC transporter permease [Haloferax mediterranei ATCC 33500]QCQ76431.1 ABC transporter permease [Haloferax med
MSLSRFLIKRSLQGLFVIWGVITVVFGLRFISPGDPANVLLPPDVDPEVRAQVIAELGLNEPLYIQYWEFISGVPVGDLGLSLVTRTPVTARVLAKLPATLELAIAATVVAIVIAIPLGVLSATRRHEPADYGATVFSLVGISTPNFWLGVMLIIVLSVQFNLFPTSQRPIGFDGIVGLLTSGNLDAAIDGFGTWLWHITLPAITLGTYFTALITRLTRSGMLDQLGQTYVRATRAKGLPETLVRYKHALRNTLIPVITVIGLQLGTLIGGAVITEAVFAWPGLGTLIINSINARDWPVLQGSLIVVAVGFVLVNILVDALYAYVNPQVAYD